MTHNANQVDEHGEIDQRRISCIVAFLHPFRIVTDSTLRPWTVSLQEINQSKWDYVALHEIIGGVDVGLEPPFHMVVTRDGALAFPPLPHLRSHSAANEFVNQSLAALLLGGIYCEAVNADGLDIGCLIDWKYLRINTAAPANRFQNLLRLRGASPIEAIQLLSPRTVQLSELTRAMAAGREVLSSVPQLKGEYLLRGTTGIARRDWNSALTNLWIVVEQITEHLWQKEVLHQARSTKPKPVDGRIDQLEDHRTWTISTRHELLFQIRVLDHSTLRLLFTARKARNNLAHSGKLPSERAARDAFDAILSLLRIATRLPTIPLQEIDIANHAISDPFLPRTDKELQVTHWMEIPKLPGESELERLEAERFRNSPRDE